MASDRLNLLLTDFERVLVRLDEALAAGSAPFARDSSILHFELCFEVAWKSARALALSQGLRPAGPRDSFSSLITLGLELDEQVLAGMLRRNDAVHLYHEALAEALRSKLPGFLLEFRRIAADSHACKLMCARDRCGDCR